MSKCKNSFRKFQPASRFWFVAHFVLLATLLSGLANTASGQEAPATRNAKSQAALNFGIVIPEILRVLENSHPPLLQLAGDTPAEPILALQRVVVLSTIGKGFCMDLSLTQAQVSQWKLRVSGTAGSWVQQTSRGYRLCLNRAGRYELALEHEFALKHTGSATARDASGLGWPVNVSLATP